MNLSIVQTDFDNGINDDSLVEEVEFVEVEGTSISVQKLRPGSNPCILMERGADVQQNSSDYTVATDVDITNDVLRKIGNVTGPLQTAHVSMQARARISIGVDECAYQGFLLNGWITVRCSPPIDSTPAALLVDMSKAKMVELQHYSRDM